MLKNWNTRPYLTQVCWNIIPSPSVLLRSEVKAEFKTELAKNKDEFKAEAKEFKEELTTNPVSYTHLDVYKRQSYFIMK